MSEQTHPMVACRLCSKPTEWKYEGCCPTCAQKPPLQIMQCFKSSTGQWINVCQDITGKWSVWLNPDPSRFPDVCLSEGQTLPEAVTIARRALLATENSIATVVNTATLLPRPDVLDQRAVDFIRRFVESGLFHDLEAAGQPIKGANPIDSLRAEAEAILEEAKRCGNLKP